ncbi:MAG: class I SAM-dependent RNA methyltransferase [Polyangiaceae bacterium]|nr:class I SAM-dependent RNA methyltransferase [Polyangiaceae bacterium]
MSCPHLDRCSGCPAMHLDYPAQLEKKAERVARALGGYPELAGLERSKAAAADPPLAYRSRAKWMVGKDGELGLFAKGADHEVVDIPECRVVEPVILEVGRALRGILRDPALGPVAGKLRAVDLRAARTKGAGARVLVTFVAPRNTLARDEVVALARALERACPQVAGVALNETSPRAIQVLGHGTELVSGVSSVPDDIGSVTVTATFGAFVQAHRGQAAAIEQAIVDAVRGLGGAPRVLELFAGSGAFALALAGAAARVDAVESHAPAARLLAERDARGVEAHAADAEVFVAEAAASGLRWDAVVVDPPRRGLTPALRKAIATLEPRLVVYVSCSPETLARDLDHFARLGLTATKVSAFDMIPQTDEVEALAVLTPSARSARAKVSTLAGSNVVEIAAHEEGRGVALPPPETGSGLALELAPGTRRHSVSFSALALVKGVPRKRGTIRGRSRYVRLSVASGHALVRIEGVSPAQSASELASIGHPVIGDPKRCDEATRRHFFEKHGLDRAAWHTDRLEAEGAPPVTSPIPGDLAAVLASVGVEI